MIRHLKWPVTISVMPMTTFRVLIVNSLHFVKRFFYHENTKVGKHEKFFSFISCFRD